ncbi:MAG: extracellular solute-binding protein [Tessaracoccus sp.]
MTRKGLAAVVSGGLLTAAMLSACGGDGNSGGGGGDAINMAVTQSADSEIRGVLTDMAATFEEETGITVNLMPASNQYESDMKVRMGANDLPDIFATHGWSVRRYKDFLEPLENEDWAQHFDPMLDSAMRDAEGHIYALPLELDTTGVLYNRDVLEAVGVDAGAVKTWDDFDTALQKVRDSGVTGIYAGGKNRYYPGNVANLMAPGFYSGADLDALLAGEFSSDQWNDITATIQGWQQDGLFNPDFVSASDDDMSRALAEGNTGMVLGQNSIAANALTYNPDANLGYFPIPNDNGDPYLVGGEGVNSFGVAKSGNVEAAKQFIAFMAQPENAARLVRGTGNPSGLTNVDAELGPLQESFDAAVAAETPLVPYFDRVYLPNGMWGPMCDAIAEIIAGTGTQESSLRTMQDNFTSLYGAAEE